ncbi:MAG: response regulator [Novosphingobium sp.]|nr:response regulator [Novosphingobium sp.]
MAKSKQPGRKPRSLGRALIVEDDPLLAMNLEDALLAGGAEAVVVCDTVSAAMIELEKLKPDILILDVQLADRDDGWAMAELVNELSPRPPAIIFSTGAPEKIPKSVSQLGAVLAKPYDPAALIAILIELRRKPGLLGRLREALAG